MRAIPTLKAKHFDGLTTMVNGGLHFGVSLTVDDWIYSYPFTGGNYADWEDQLRQRAAKRMPSRIELNPRTMTGDEIVEICRASQRKLKNKEHINVAYGLPGLFDREWSVDQEVQKLGVWRKREAQRLVLAAFDDCENLVGYSSFNASCSAPIDRAEKYDVRFNMEMVYGGCPEFCVNGASVKSWAFSPRTGW